MQVFNMLLLIFFTLSIPVLFLFTVKRFLPVPSRRRQLMLAVVGALAVNQMIWIGEVTNILFVAACIFIAIPLLCKGQKPALFSVSLLLFSFIISSRAVLLSSLRPPLDQYEYDVLFSFLLWLAIVFFVRRFIDPEAVQTIRKQLWLLLDAASLFPFGVTVVILLFAQFSPVSGSTNELVIGNEPILMILLVLSAVFSLGLLLSVALLARQEALEQQQMLWKMRSQHYEMVEQNQIQVRRLRHDMANHLNAMAGMDDKTLREFLAELAATPAMTTGQRFCENEIVNAVLSGKLPMIENAGIQAEVHVSLPAKLPISEIDLCAVFSNCLDNAMEACQKCEPESRRIQLHAKAAKGLFSLQLENSMSGMLRERNGRLLTTKPDQKNHGLGMAEIGDIAQRYGGILKYTQEDNLFKMQISIPLTP